MTSAPTLFLVTLSSLQAAKDPKNADARTFMFEAILQSVE